MSKFQYRLRELRERDGYSQRELAEIMHMSNVAISQYESGVRRPDLNTLIVFSKLFNVTTDYLLGRASDPNLTYRNERDIGNKIEEIKRDLASADTLMMYGDILTDEDKEKLQQALEIVITLSKKEAKEKFNPNKNGQK